MTSTYTLNSICETDGYDPGYYATIINKHINVHFNCLSLFSRREKVCTVDPNKVYWNANGEIKKIHENLTFQLKNLYIHS